MSRHDATLITCFALYRQGIIKFGGYCRPERTDRSLDVQLHAVVLLSLIRGTFLDLPAYQHASTLRLQHLACNVPLPNSPSSEISTDASMHAVMKTLLSSLVASQTLGLLCTLDIRQHVKLTKMKCHSKLYIQT